MGGHTIGPAIRRATGPLALSVPLMAVLILPGCGVRSPVEAEYDGSTQRLSLSADGYFYPNLISVRPDVPIELEFGPGRGCTVEVHFPDLGISAELREPATVTLPPLEPGSYAIHCQDDMRMGTLYVE